MQCQHGGGAAVSAAKASAAIANTSQTRKHATATEGGGLITLALTGDVMLGRAVDCAVGRHTGHQLDPYVHAARGGDALALVACLRKAQSALHSFFLYLYCRTLHEKCVASALGYIALAERARGALPRNEMARLGGAYPLAAVAREFEAADLAVVNVETALTTSNDWLPKGINYRAHPGNALAALHAIGVPPRGVATLANNHILDWGRQGLLDTLRSLDAAGAVRAGAGFDAADAAKPAEIRVRDTLVRVAALGSESSGVPPSWDEGIQGYDQYRDDLAVLWRATLGKGHGHAGGARHGAVPNLAPSCDADQRYGRRRVAARHHPAREQGARARYMRRGTRRRQPPPLRMARVKGKGLPGSQHFKTEFLSVTTTQVLPR